MITKKQLADRVNGIFSSDVPRIMAGDAVRVVLEKIGELKPDDLSGVPEIQLGNIVEPRILDAFEAKEGVTLVRSPDTLRHLQHPWLGAHLDAMVPGLLNVEAKSVGWYNRSQWGEPGTDETPERVLWQTQEQLAVTGLPMAKVPVCFLNEEALVALATGRPLPIEVYVVPSDAEIQAYIIERCGKVWEHVKARTVPPAEKPMDARLIYRRDSGAVVEADLNMIATCLALTEVKAELKARNDRKDALEAEVQSYMKYAAELRHNGRVLATWKLDSGRKAYTVAARSPARTFRLKGETK